GSENLFIRQVFTSVQDSGSLSGYIRTYVFVRFSSPCSHKEMYPPELNSIEKPIMESEFLDKVEDNALKEIWAQWDDEVKQLFYYNYGDLPYLLDIKVDEHLF
ncbi:hypothetical protein Gotur_034980, partial [Gossypium turneri]